MLTLRSFAGSMSTRSQKPVETEGPITTRPLQKNIGIQGNISPASSVER